MDFQSLMALISCTGSIIFGYLLLRFPDRRPIHTLLSYTLIFNGLIHIMRAFYWEYNHPVFNQLSVLGLATLPLVVALFVEQVSQQRFNSWQKVFFLSGAVSLFVSGLHISWNNTTPFLLSLLGFHILCLIFYLQLLHRGQKLSKNFKQKNIISCLIISFYSIFGLALLDWAYKLGYGGLRVFPLSFAIFIYYLSIIIYSAGQTQWYRESLKLFGLGIISLSLGGLCYLVTPASLEQVVSLSLAAFALIVSAFAIYNQVNLQFEALFSRSKPLFDWSNSSIDLETFIKQLNEKPEFHNLSILKESYVHKHKCDGVYHCFGSAVEVVAREKVLARLKKSSLSEAEQKCAQEFLFLFEVSHSDYMVLIPHTRDLLCIRFINIVNPNLYSDFLFGIAHKISLFYLAKEVKA